jgi:hypothetical protein
MSRAIAILLAPATAGRQVDLLLQTLGVLGRCWRELIRDALRPYRPEQHYMRGPGPAWRAKHGNH